MQATLTFLGSGTSMGVPTLGCTCAVCQSAMAAPGTPGADRRNRRTRPSIMLRFAEHTVLVDTGPDFHAQALREQIMRVDAVFYTHSHADHILGMDDLRPLSFRGKGELPLYADVETSAALRRVFHYTFRTEDRYPTSARVAIHALPETLGETVDLLGIRMQPIPVQHGRQMITGYRFGNAAYLTDLSELPPESVPLLQGLDILIVDALRREPHPSHSHLAKSIALAELLKPQRTFFTHMSHELDHAATELELPPNIRLGYDGLQLQFDIAPEHA